MYLKTKQLSKHKSLELQIDKWKEATNYYVFENAWSKNCDHAGFRLYIGIFSWFVSFNIYDHRHWDYKNKCWEV